MSQAQDFVIAFMDKLAGSGVTLNPTLRDVFANILANQVTVNTDTNQVSVTSAFTTLSQVFTFIATPADNKPASPVGYGTSAIDAAKESAATDNGLTLGAPVEPEEPEVPVDGETFSLTAGSTSVNEGGAVTYSITNGEPDTEYTYTISGVDAADIDGGALTGTVTTNAAGEASFVVTTLEDGVTEGAETMVVTIGSTTASVTVNDTSAAPDFVLTTAGDRLEDELTAGNDVILAPQGTLGSTDAILDASTSDNDSLTAYVSTEVAPTIQKIENVNLIWTSNTALTFDAANSSDSTFNLSSNSNVFSGDATVKNVGKNNVVADAATITGTLTVQGAVDTTIDAGSATAVTLGTAGTVPTVGVKTAANVTVNNNITLDNSAATAVENVTITSTVDDVIVTEAAFSAEKLTFAGDKSVIYNGVLTAEEIANELTGDATLTVQSNADTALDTTKIAADLIELDAASNTAITVANNQNFKLKATTASVASFTDGAGITDATVNLEVNGDITTTALDISGIKTLNLDVAKDTAVTALKVDGNNKVNVSGSKAFTITAMTGSTEAIEIDASALTGKFTVTDSTVDVITSITGSDTAANAIKVAATTNKTTINTGSANDTIVADTVTSGALTINAGDGNNTIDANALTLAAAATITTGSGDDTISSNSSATFNLSKKLKIDAGNGKNTVDLSNQTTGFLEITTGSGDDTINLADFTTAGTTADANASVITTGAGTDTVDLSAYNTGKLTVNSGAGKTTVTLGAASSSTQEFTFNAGSTDDILKLGAGTTAIDTLLAKAFDISSVSNLEVVEGSTLAGWQLSGQDFNIKGLNSATTLDGTNGTITVQVVDADANAAETTDLSSLNFSTTKTEYIKTVNITGLNNVADTIKGSTQNDVIDAGGGNVKDIIDISQGGNDTIKIGTAGDSTFAKDADYMDVITGFKTGTATDTDTDKIDFSGAAVVAADASGVDVSSAVADAGTYVVTASITDGILTVGGTDLTKIDTLLEWIDVAKAAMADTTGGRTAAAHDTVAFEFGGDTYVYNEPTAATNHDIVQLVDVTGVVAVGTTEAANTIFIG